MLGWYKTIAEEFETLCDAFTGLYARVTKKRG